MSAVQRFSYTILAAWALTLAARPALAEYFSYQGQIQMQSAPGDGCAEMSPAPFDITIYGRDDAPGRRIDGYLDGEKIVHAHFSGNYLNQLSLTFPGESSASHTLRLRAAGDGAFAGELEAKSLLTALSGCKFSNAQIRFTRTAIHTQAAYDQAASLFQLDSRAVEAYVLGMRGKVKQAAPVLEEGLAVKEKTYGLDHPQLLPYYFLLAQLHDAAGSYREEGPLYRKALAVCEKAYGPQSRCAAMALTSLSGVQSKTGDFGDAESSVRRSMAICDKACGPESALSAANLNMLGAILIFTGHFGDAETTLNRALALNKKTLGPADANVGLNLNNLAVLYRYTGQYAKSEAAMRQALAIDEKALGADSPLVIINTVVLAQILRISGRNADAEPIARRGLAAAERVLGPERPDHPALSMALGGLAEVLREKAAYAEAEPLYRRALANDIKYLGADHPDVATISLLLAKLLRATGRDAEALTLLKSAYRITHISANQMIAWRVPGELMQFYSSGKSAQPDIAIFFGKEAVNKLQQLRGNLAGSGDEAQQAFVSAAEVKSVYRSLADLLAAQSRLSEAQQVLTMIKEQELYEFSQRTAELGARRTVATLNTSEKDLDDLGAKDVALGKEYGALQEKMQKQHELGPAERARLNTLRNEMDAAQTKFESRVAAVAKSSADPEAQKRRRQEINDYSRAFEGTLKDLGHDAVLAQYFILDDHVEILLTTPNVVIARQAPIKRAELTAQILAYRKTLSAPDRDPLPQAQALYRVLMEPIAADLRQAGAKTLMLSLDDTLRYLPFAALHDGKSYLVENMSLVMVTEAVRDKLGKAPVTNWSIWGLGVTQGGVDYPALPYVGVELNGITGPKGILAGQVLLDKAFNESSLRDGLDRSFPIIHIASHFQFTSGSMNDSFLLLGDGSRMTLAQIKNKLDFKNVELLTLSACETAVGDEVMAHHGDEVEGLGAIAQQAGAKAVLATLWPVADGSTALLMRTLYKAHKEQHVDKADALRQAQLGLLHGTTQADASIQGQRGLTRVGTVGDAGSAGTPGEGFKIDPAAPFAHPFFWAPFILMGNWL